MPGQIHNLTVVALERDGRRYKVQIDDSRRVVEAYVHVKAHDKRPTLRRVVNRVTLGILQGMLQAPAVCRECGRPFAATEKEKT